MLKNNIHMLEKKKIAQYQTKKLICHNYFMNDKIYQADMMQNPNYYSYMYKKCEIYIPEFKQEKKDMRNKKYMLEGLYMLYIWIAMFY